MGLLFSRYANPFLLMDHYMKINRLSAFLVEFFESENEKNMWEFYLHKVHDMSFEEYKQEVMQKTETVDEEQVGNMISDTRDMLSDFIP